MPAKPFRGGMINRPPCDSLQRTGGDWLSKRQSQPEVAFGRSWFAKNSAADAEFEDVPIPITTEIDLVTADSEVKQHNLNIKYGGSGVRF